jgi:hypothetical protein
MGGRYDASPICGYANGSRSTRGTGRDQLAEEACVVVVCAGDVRWPADVTGGLVACPVIPML